MTARGRLITFEGGEGAGKSTQVARLAASLRAAGLAVVATREPGGTPGGEAIRGLLVEGSPGRWSPPAETLLLLAARHDHVLRVIEPAMAAGRWVLCDRFTDSTRVYQGIAGAVGLGLVDELHRMILGDLQPDLTLVLDLPVPVGLARRRASSGENRFERMPEDYHERVRAGFLAIARGASGRCVVIDAGHSEETVGRRIRAVVDARFGLDLAGAV
jgi:dTMP kinase